MQASLPFALLSETDASFRTSGSVKGSGPSLSQAFLFYFLFHRDRRRNAVAALAEAKWACLDSILSFSAQQQRNLPAAPQSASPSSGGAPCCIVLEAPSLLHRVVSEALDEIQMCAESGAVPVLRCLRRCWAQALAMGTQGQVGREIQRGPDDVFDVLMVTIMKARRGLKSSL